jgi:hypothetical protein
VNFWALSLGALVLMGPRPDAAAQTPSPGTLNRLEVQRLAASPTAADHRRLALHFSGLADRYTAIGKRHMTMAHALPGNPNRETGYGRQAHFKRLAKLNTQWATTSRELATHHERLAAGTESVPPRDARLFEAGAGAPEPTEEDLSALAAEARTPADHRALEIAYSARADRYTAQASEHLAMASAYRGTKIASAAVHCDRLVMQARTAAREASAAALRHKALADTTG